MFYVICCNPLHGFFSVSICDLMFYCSLISHFLLLFVFLRVCVCICSCLLNFARVCMCVLHYFTTSKWPLLSNCKISCKNTPQECSTKKSIFLCGMAAVCVLCVMSVHPCITFELLQEPWQHDPRHALWRNQNQTS